MGDAEVLRSQLIQSCLNKDSDKCKKIIRKVIECNTRGIDVSPLFPEMIKASATNDIVQKKLVYFYICDCAYAKPDLALLSVNTLVNDAMYDVNPMVRGLALRSMFNMRVQDLIRYMRQPLLSALEDRSSYVRRHAVMAANKLFKSSPQDFKELQLAGKLQAMIFDDDAQVSISALCCLDEALQEAGGLSLDEKLVTFFLFERLPNLNEWGQCLLLEKLARYTPSSENATLQYLNCLDGRLKHSNKAVVMAAINLFLKYTKKIDHIKNDVYERIRTPILTMLQTSVAELQLSILHHITVLTQLKPRLFSRDYKHFYLKFNEPAYVKLKKLEILTQVLTEGNYQSIIDEMKEYIHHSEKELSFYCLKLLAKIALGHTFTVNVIVKTLLEVLKLEVDYLTSSLMVVFQELISKHKSVAHVILPEISEYWSYVKDDPPARAALIWIYGEYGEHIERAPYDLEQLLDNIANEYSDEVKLAMLTATIKLFFKRPPECQELIGKLLRHCIDTEKNMCVRDKALFYHRLLQNVNDAKTVLLSKDRSNPMPAHHGLLQTIQDSDFRFAEFNSLSLMYNQPSSFFCHLYNSWRHVSLREDTDLPNSVKEATDIVVEKILDIDVNTELNSFKLEEVKFDQDFHMEKSEFQTFWKTAIHSDRFEETIMTNISQNEIAELAVKAGFKLLATSRPDDAKIRLLMYTKLATKEDVSVIEFVVQNEIKKISILVKAGNDETVDELLSYLKDTLVKDLVVSAHET